MSEKSAIRIAINNAQKAMQKSLNAKLWGDEEEGKKFDSEKVRVDLLPVQSLTQIARVLTFGATKYGDRNWEKGILYGRIYGAALRHLFKWWAGEDTDKETGLSHLAHANCCLLFLLEFEFTHPEMDNRPKGGTCGIKSSRDTSRRKNEKNVRRHRRSGSKYTD